MKMNAAAYGLRDNPKKSLRVSDTCGGRSSVQNVIACKICGKGFEKRRQLCGHLRHHTTGGVMCKECGKPFKSIRALCGHMKSHSDDRIGIRAVTITDCSVFLFGNVGVRKRARTPRFEVSRRTHFHFDSNLIHDEEEEEESALEQVAVSLIMLSQGLEFSAAAPSDASVNAVELVEGFKSDGFKSLMSEAVEMGFCSCGKHSSEMDDSKTVEFDSRVKDEMGGVRIHTSDHVKPEDGICRVSGSALKYRCVSCNKDFSSHQALGGHRSSKHKLRRCSSTLKTETEGVSKKPECDVVDDVQKYCAVGVPHFELLKRCKHKCALCFKVFRSDKALGMHAGVHVAESTAIDQVQQPRSMQGTSVAELSMISQSPLTSRKMVLSWPKAMML